MTEGAAPDPLGVRLLAAGWRQGSLFAAPWAKVYWNETGGSGDPPGARSPKAKERYVVATQTCDIRIDPGQEPYIEALLCAVETRQAFLEAIDRNSARWFVVDPTNGLVAQAKYRVQVAKAALAELRAEPWPSGENRLQHFVQWLARRYDRPAFPDEVVESLIEPATEALRSLEGEQPDVFAAFNRAVREIRVSLPHGEEPPFDLHVMFLLHGAGLTTEMDDALEAVRERIRSCAAVETVRLDPVMRAMTEDEMAVSHYFATRPIFLDYYTYHGEKIDGAEPLPRL